MLFFKLIRESFIFAVSSLTTNRVRSFLSLAGITIGIFAIISVLTVVDSLERKIRDSIESLGSNVIYIQKWPWEFGSDYPWWKYMQRPEATIIEYEEIKRRSENASAVSFMISGNKTAQYEGSSAENASIVMTSHEYENIRTFEIASGRYFSPLESSKGYPRAIIGVDIARILFNKKNPVGKIIKIDGYKLLVTGVFKKEGKDMFENSSDNTILIPINYARNIIDIRNERLNPMIMVRAKNTINIDELSEELRIIMRSTRRLKPIQEDNFSLNQASLISKGFEPFFKGLNFAGIIIGGFSILVGGFGIANIMFVSVKERTRIIGIQKALGAKKYFILLQFLYESIILSLLGGIAGLGMIYFGTIIANKTLDFGISLSLFNIIVGVSISVIIGIISGYAPAYAAAKLDPVKAISTN